MLHTWTIMLCFLIKCKSSYTRVWYIVLIFHWKMLHQRASVKPLIFTEWKLLRKIIVYAIIKPILQGSLWDFLYKLSARKASPENQHLACLLITKPSNPDLVFFFIFSLDLILLYVFTKSCLIISRNMANYKRINWCWK